MTPRTYQPANDDLMKKALACALAAVLAGSVCAPALASAAESPDSENEPDPATAKNDRAADTGTAAYTKDEAVYGVLDAGGTPETLYVVNQFNVETAGSVIDYGAYDALENLTDTSAIASTDATQILQAEKGVYYYEGTVKSGQLPWNVDITYTLDGKEVSPDDLAGADGRIGVHIITSKNDAVDAVFFDNYMLQVSFTVPTAACSNIDTQDAGIIADAGENRQITYTVMPEKDGDLTFEADAIDFEMSALQIAGAPFSMSMDDFDTAGMADGMQELADGVASINDGAGQLADGTGELAGGVEQLAGGAGQLADGAGQIASGAEGLATGAGSISQALSQLSAGVSQTASASEQVSSGLSSLAASSSSVNGAAGGVASDASALASALAALDTSNMSDADRAAVESLRAQAATLSQSASQASSAVGSYTAATDELASGAASLNGAVGSLAGGLSQTAGGAESLAAGASELAGGTSQIASSTSDLASGTSELASGTSELASGTSELADGTAEFASSTADLPTKMQEEIDEAMASYSGDFDPISFTSPDNTNIELVQFVLTTKAIEIPDEDVSVEEEPVPGFMERVTNLFTGLFS